MVELPEPMVTPDCDCRGLPFMPLEVQRFLDSDLMALSTGDEFKAAVTLWCKAWQQVPAASLPDDDRILAKFSGVSLTEWPTIKDMALRNWIRCSDGRLYHPVIADLAIAAFKKRRGQAERANSRWAKAKSDDREGMSRSQRLAAARQIESHTKEQWTALLDACGRRCVKCGAVGVEIVKDHIRPLVAGGSDGIVNLQPLCTPCNSGKTGDMTDYRPANAVAAASQMPAIPNETPASAGISAGGGSAERLQVKGTVEGREPPKVPQGGAGPEGIVVTKADLDAIWEATPRLGRERSSRKELDTSVKAAAKRGHRPGEVLLGVRGYYASRDATKDGGQYAKGVHRIVTGDRWRNFVQEGGAAAPTLPLGAPAAPPSSTDVWRWRVERYRRLGLWEDLNWDSPNPRRAGCRAPAAILREFGYEPRDAEGNVIAFPTERIAS